MIAAWVLLSDPAQLVMLGGDWMVSTPRQPAFPPESREEPSA